MGRKQNFRKTTRFLPEIQSAFKRVLYQELRNEWSGIEKNEFKGKNYVLYKRI